MSQLSFKYPHPFNTLFQRPSIPLSRERLAGISFWNNRLRRSSLTLGPVDALFSSEMCWVKNAIALFSLEMCWVKNAIARGSKMRLRYSAQNHDIARVVLLHRSDQFNVENVSVFMNSFFFPFIVSSGYPQSDVLGYLEY